MVKIYIIPFGRESVLEPDVTPDYLRVHAESQIMISDGIIIRELLEKIKKISKTTVREINICDFNRCRIAVDFIEKNTIIYSIVIASNGEFIIQHAVNGWEVKVNKEDNTFLCYLKSLFPTLVECLPFIKCK